MQIDYDAKIIDAKVVYAGPEPRALFDSLAHIFKATGGPNPAKLAEPTNVTHGFAVPMQFGTLRGLALKFTLATSPSTQPDQVRRQLMQHVDGVIFVASKRCSPAENLAALRALSTSLGAAGFDLTLLPRVLQVDAVDEASSAEALAKVLPVPFPAAIASQAAAGVGVFDALKAVTRQVLSQVAKQA